MEVEVVENVTQKILSPFCFCRPFRQKKVFGLEMFPTCVSSEHCALFLLCTSELLASRRGSPRAFPPLAHTPCSGCTSFYPGYIHKSSISEFGYRPSCIWQGWRFSILSFKKVRRNILGWNQFLCILRGARLLLANCTKISATSEAL